MKFNFNKIIYDKKMIFKALKDWEEYISKIEITEDKKYITLTVKSIKNQKNINHEFVNYILDLCSIEELK